MATPFVQVISADGSQLVDLAAERCVVGSSIACTVVVELPEIAREHMLLSPRPDGCYVAIARGAPTPIVYNGAPLERGIVPWGSEVTIGTVRFVLHDGSTARALFAAARAQAAAGGAGRPAVSPVILVAVVVTLAAVAWMYLNAPEAPPQNPHTPPPALFDPLQRTCAQADVTSAREAADDTARRAEAEAERLPFSSQDGIAAVDDYANAAACYARAGDAANAAANLAAAGALAARIDDEFRNHRFRLERALEQNRPDDALLETRMLKNLVAHRQQSAYYQALVTLEHTLTLRIEQARTAGTPP